MRPQNIHILKGCMVQGSWCRVLGTVNEIVKSEKLMMNSS